MAQFMQAVVETVKRSNIRQAEDTGGIYGSLQEQAGKLL
jgi:hypothetical protein